MFSIYECHLLRAILDKVFKVLHLKTVPFKNMSFTGSSDHLYIPGDISRATSDTSFGDPEERIVDAKLEGGKTIVRSKEKEVAAKVSVGALLTLKHVG